MIGESCYEKPTMDSASWQTMDRVVVCREKGAGELSSSQGRKVDEKSNGIYCIVHWGVSCQWFFLIMCRGGVARVLQRGLRCRLSAGVSRQNKTLYKESWIKCPGAAAGKK